MAKTKIGNATITHADCLVSQEEVESEKRAKAEGINQKLAEIDAKKPDELTLVDINAKLDLILNHLGIR